MSSVSKIALDAASVTEAERIAERASREPISAEGIDEVRGTFKNKIAELNGKKRATRNKTDLKMIECITTSLAQALDTLRSDEPKPGPQQEMQNKGGKRRAGTNARPLQEGRINGASAAG